jgi:hypothetical protein
MNDGDKTKKQLVDEVTELRQLIVRLEESEKRREQIEGALKESEERYKRLFESVTDYVYMVKIEDCRPVSTNHGICPECAKKLYPEFYKEKE